MKPTKLLLGCFALICAIGSSLYADPMQVLSVRLHYKRSTSELTIEDLKIWSASLPARKGVIYPAFMVRILNENGLLLDEFKTDSPFVSDESKVDADEASFSVFFSYSDEAREIEIYEISDELDEEMDFIASVAIPSL